MLHNPTPTVQVEEKAVGQLEDVRILAVLEVQGHRAIPPSGQIGR